jgi:hypothetical protein
MVHHFFFFSFPSFPTERNESSSFPLATTHGMIQAHWAIYFQAKITHGKMNGKKKYDEGVFLMAESVGGTILA